MDTWVGQSLGNGQYKIIARIGKGGMATVYRAHQTSVERDVAVKIINVDLAEEKELQERFAREARTIASLNHLHILKVFDYGVHNGVAYLVMELLEGGSLSQQLRAGGGLPLPRAVKLVDQVAQALDYAHGRGIIHRDLKPDNILLDNFGNAFLTDFGIAKLVRETKRYTVTGHVMGTASYMAPEQWEGSNITGAVDIYALGITLYEMLTGNLPFQGETPFQLMHQHVNTVPPAVTDRNRNVPVRVNEVIQKSLAKRPQDRFSSAGELARAFANASGLTPSSLPAAPDSLTASTAADLTGPAYTPPKPRPALTPDDLSAGTLPPTLPPGTVKNQGGRRADTTIASPRPTVQTKSGGRGGLLMGGLLLVILALGGAAAVLIGNRAGEETTQTAVAALNQTSAAEGIATNAEATLRAVFTGTANAEGTRRAIATEIEQDQSTRRAALTQTAEEEESRLAATDAEASRRTVIAAAQLPTKTQTPTFTPTSTSTLTPTATNTPTLTPSATSTDTPSPTLTSTPTATYTPSITNTPTPGLETVIAATVAVFIQQTEQALNVEQTVNARLSAAQTADARLRATQNAAETFAAVTPTPNTAQLQTRAAQIRATQNAANARATPFSLSGTATAARLGELAATRAAFMRTPTATAVNRCPGFLPSRLVIGGRGRISPGTPNRLRADPNTQARQLSNIPEGEIIDILNGPVCTQTGSGEGIAWWEVRWRSTFTGNVITGWTAEGLGNEYWIDPLR